MKKLYILLIALIAFGCSKKENPEVPENPEFIISGWTRLNSGTTERLNSIYFTDANTGYAAGGLTGGYPTILSSRILLKTSNGGESWNQLLLDGNNQFYSIFFTSTDTGYAIGGFSS